MASQKKNAREERKKLFVRIIAIVAAAALVLTSVLFVFR